MRITQWGEYGVHFAIFLARRDTRTPVGAAEIAHAQGVEVDYAQQILRRLRRGGVVESVRGPQGGFRLCRAPREILLLDILVAAEGNSFEVICETRPINEARCSTTQHCGVRGLWFELKDHVNDFLRRYSLEDLVNRSLNDSSPDSNPVQIKSSISTRLGNA